MKHKKILIVDDELINIHLLVDLLGDNYTVLTALDGQSALKVFIDEGIDLVLLDIIMPEMDGYQVCEKLLANKKQKEVSIIFVTAENDKKSIEKGYKTGCIDFIIKPFIPAELFFKVERELKTQELIANLEVSQRELKYLASIDPLTKLYNRRHFTQTSKHIFNLAIRNKSHLSIIMLDIDGFKSLNDTYGHQIGDDVLVCIADVLKRSVRQSDIICRFGGEEFVILLPNTATSYALSIAEKIRLSIENISINVDDNDNIKLKITASFGISKLNQIGNKNIEEVIDNADKAMYKAKKSGKNKVCIH